MHLMTSSNNFLVWTEQEIVRSRTWDVRLQRLRTEANRSRRACKPFVELESLHEIDELILEWQGLPRDQRPYAWTEKRVNEYSLTHPSADPAPATPLKDLQRYRSSLENSGPRYFGAPMADELHQLVRRPRGGMPEIPIVVSEFPNPVRSHASMGAAYVTGAEFGSAGARRQAHCRARPMNSPNWPGQEFSLYVRLNGDR